MGMVDAAVGIKTAVNFHEKKNKLGTYCPPLAVFYDRCGLLTATDRICRPRPILQTEGIRRGIVLPDSQAHPQIAPATLALVTLQVVPAHHRPAQPVQRRGRDAEDGMHQGHAALRPSGAEC